MSLNPELTHADQSREHLSSKTAYIDKVPNEILGYIFNSYVDMNQSPWNLSLVSYLWRSAASADSTLWTNIGITGYVDRKNYRDSTFTKWSIKSHCQSVYTAGKYQICTDNDDLLMCLERTGSATLNISVDGSEVVSPLDLLRPPLSSRIGTLKFRIGTRKLGDLDFNPGPFTSLKYLSIHSWGCDYFMTRLLESVQVTAFNLTKLSLGRLPMKYEKLDSLSELWRRIQYLEIADGHLADLILSHCSHLIGFNCNDHDWPVGPCINNKILAKIQSLSLHGPPEELHHFHLPSLQALTITHILRWSRDMWKECKWTGPEDFTLPSLISLQVQCSSLVWLHHLHAPSLTELEIIVQVDPCGCKDDLQKIEDTSFHPSCLLKPSLWSRFSNISKLTLGAHCKEEYFNIAMDSFPNIQSLYLIPRASWLYQEYGLQILDHLVDISVAGSLPRLKIFKFGSWKNPIFLPKDTLDSRVNSLVELQRAKGMDMLCCNVYWYRDLKDIKLERYII